MSQSGADSKRYVTWAVTLIPIIGLAAIAFYIAEPLIFPGPLPEEYQQAAAITVDDAKDALRAKDYVRAATLARQLLEKDSGDAEVLLVAGEAVSNMGDYDAAVGFYRGVPESAGPQYVVARWATANVYLNQGKLREAEAAFRDALRKDPKHIRSNQGLGMILGWEGRRWESVPYLFEPIRQGQIYMEPLMLLGTIDYRDPDARPIIEKSRQVNPDDWLPLLGTARIDLFEGRLDDAEKLLREILQHVPHQVEAYGLLGLLMVERPEKDSEKFHAWLAGLPEGADQDPTIWYAKGVWAQNHGEPEGAARCFWEAARINPNHQRAHYRLARLLTSLGRPSDAEPFLQRAGLLEKVVKTMGPLFNQSDKRPEVDRMIEVAQLCEQLGRYWESWAWFHLTMTVDPNNETAKTGTQRLRALTSSGPPLVVKDALPTTLVDLSNLPLPVWRSSGGQPSAVAAALDSHPQFVNTAHDAGFDFVYNTGDDPKAPGMMITQQSGGAIAVIDYDLDDWPDIYVAQGGPWPRDPNQTQYRDRLFRNLGNGKFTDVTEQAGLGDTEYGQGTAIGDYDNDGWPDILVANIGSNRLYHNQGDGTFADVTADAGITGQRWSSSVAIADLNGDGFSDLYVVNYLAGKEPLEMICFDRGQQRACPPNNFSGEQDHLFLNQGDGRFVDVTQECGIVAPAGVGLGVIVCDFRGTGKPCIYVGNDMTANFFFVNQAKERGDPLQFQELALPAGLAYDRNGLPQASMGITAGDGDDDGLIDLFLGHYYAESNTFYKQISPDLFEDVSEAMGLRQPSLQVLTFGTQFIDFENDGRLDLACACGHVDDFRYRGEPFMMKPQLYANLGKGKFVLVPPDTVGDYFMGEYLGRSLALIDWDRDGRQDFGILNLDAPAALLANRTANPGHYLTLHLKGIESERDAITTTVHARIGDRMIVRQLTAGDGFQCSNQRVIHLGLADAKQIDELHIRWPTGMEQKFEHVPADREVLLLEGAGQLVDLPRD